jgi:hypothetical protein
LKFGIIFCLIPIYTAATATKIITKLKENGNSGIDGEDGVPIHKSVKTSKNELTGQVGKVSQTTPSRFVPEGHDNCGVGLTSHSPLIKCVSGGHVALPVQVISPKTCVVPAGQKGMPIICREHELGALQTNASHKLPPKLKEPVGHSGLAVQKPPLRKVVPEGQVGRTSQI